MLMTAAGPGSLQVFTDFEHVLTKFKAESGTDRNLDSSTDLIMSHLQGEH